MNQIKRGSVYYIDASSKENVCGEQNGIRPAVVISNDIGNSFAPVVTVAFLTTKCKKYIPTHVTTNATGRKSTILCEQIKTVSKEKLLSYICNLPDKDLKKVDRAISISLGIDGRGGV